MRSALFALATLFLLIPSSALAWTSPWERCQPSDFADECKTVYGRQYASPKACPYSQSSYVQQKIAKDSIWIKRETKEPDGHNYYSYNEFQGIVFGELGCNENNQSRNIVMEFLTRRGELHSTEWCAKELQTLGLIVTLDQVIWV